MSIPIMVHQNTSHLKSSIDILFHSIRICGTCTSLFPWKRIFFEILLCSSGILTYLLLGGQTPFTGGNDYETLQNIRQGSWTFGDRFPTISADAKDFITRLLNPDQQNRLTSEQALNHPWLRFALQHVDTVPITSDRLQGVYSRQLYDVRSDFSVV